ncbi:MAG: hypothetical protein D6712_12800, partial [Chloroflexi bacterium]
MEISGKDIKYSIFNTGDNNTIIFNRQHQLNFIELSAEQREKYRKGSPDAFYDGAQPNWANIAKQDDAPRDIYKEIHTYLTGADGPGYRNAIILAPSGEGKTTLLMRLAWDLAEADHPVFWYDEIAESDFTLQEVERQFEKPPILCFDDAHLHLEDIAKLVKSLRREGLPFYTLMAARRFEWRSLNETSQISGLREFTITKLSYEEADAIIKRLEERNYLGALEKLDSHEERIRRLLDRYENAMNRDTWAADGQLLPAMLEVHHDGDFQRIVLSVLEDVKKHEKGDLLLDCYALLAAVHRFGFWLGREVFFKALTSRRDDTGSMISVMQLLRTDLDGELIELKESGPRLMTRHAIIARVACTLLAERFGYDLTEGVYAPLLEAVAARCDENPKTPERKLLTMLPLAYEQDAKQARDEKERQHLNDLARALHQEALGVIQRHKLQDAVVYQVAALRAKRDKRFDEARKLFQRGVQADPNHAPSLQAWALMEKDLKRFDEARQLFQRGVQA